MIVPEPSILDNIILYHQDQQHRLEQLKHSMIERTRQQQTAQKRHWLRILRRNLGKLREEIALESNFIKDLFRQEQQARHQFDEQKE